MKKFFFYTSLILGIYLLILVIDILMNDMGRLTNYGFGYLIGKVILLLIFGGLSYYLRPSFLKP